MPRNTQLTVWLGIVLLLAARSGAADEVRDAIQAGNKAFTTAFLKGDADAVARLYTDDAQVIAPGAPVVRGHSAIAASWKKTMDTGIKDLKLQTADVESAGELAYETGTVHLVSKDGTTSQARYLVVWKRDGGKWKLHRDIWNSEK